MLTTGIMQVMNIEEGCGTYKIFGMTRVKASILHNNFEKHVFENIMENGAFALNIFENIMENGAFALLEQMHHFP